MMPVIVGQRAAWYKQNMKNVRFNFLFRSLVVPTLFFVTACRPMFPPISVFVDNVPFRTDPQDSNVLIYQSPHLKAISYSKFLIEPVHIYSNESAGNRGIEPKEELLLAETFRQQLMDVLKNGYEIVDKPGPGVLRIRTAILDIQPAHVELDENKFIVLRLDTLLARVAMELDCLDSVSGERVAALIHTLKGRRYMEKGKAVRFSNIQEAFGVWTLSLRKRFDEARSRPNEDKKKTSPN